MAVQNQFIQGGQDYSILTKDYVQVANRIQDFAGFSQTWDNIGVFTKNYPDGGDTSNFTSNFLLGYSLTSSLNALDAIITATRPAGETKFRLGNTVELSLTQGSNKAGYFIQNGGVGSALGVPQPHIRTVDVDSGTAVVGRVLTLTAVTGEVEFQPIAPGSQPAASSFVTAANLSAGQIGTGALPNVTDWANIAITGYNPFPVFTLTLMNGGGGFYTVTGTGCEILVAGVYEVTASIHYTNPTAVSANLIGSIVNVPSTGSIFKAMSNSNSGSLRVSGITNFPANAVVALRVACLGSTISLAIKHVEFSIKKI